MSSTTLREALDEKNRLNPPDIPCVEKDHRAVSMIMFCPWQEAIWLLPWSRLDAIRHVDEDAVERVELSFSHHRVVAVGENLRQILEWCRNSQVLCLRSMPAAHRACLRPTAPFITQLEVKLLADLKNQPAGELPF
jgi:hypothetical protein